MLQYAKTLSWTLVGWYGILALLYGLGGDYRRMMYWICAAGITVSVTI
jgi:hypothetical protein